MSNIDETMVSIPFPNEVGDVPTGKNPVLEIRNLAVSFKTDNGMVRAVRGVAFDLYKGETLCIVGESGSGKSVTSKTIMGILGKNARIDSGSVVYEGEDLTKISEEEFHRIRGSKIGMIFQDPLSSLNPIMKIGKQITEVMIINGNHLKRRYEDIILEDLIKVKNEERKISLAHEKYIDSLNNLTKGDPKNKEKKALLRQDFKNEKAAMVEELRGFKKLLRGKKVIGHKEVKAYRVSILKEHSKKKKELVHKYLVDQFRPSIFYREFLKAHRETLSKFHVTQKEAKAKALKVMEEVGIPEPARRFNQFPFEFSGGMRQRIVIAIALTADPDLLICDEPTTALDVTIQAQILELINRIKKDRGMSVIFITHDLGVVANMADRVAVMYAGKIVEYGTANEIFYHPAHPYTWALLSSIPDIDSKERLEAIPGTPPNMLFPPKGDAFALRSKYAMGVDFKKESPMWKITSTHYAATWLLDPRSPKSQMPSIVSKRIENSLRKAGVKDA